MKTSNHQRLNLDRGQESGEVTENKCSYRFFRMFDLKTKPLKCKDLVASVRALEGEKKGDPKNEGESGVVYENKGRKKPPTEGLGISLKTSELSVF